LIWMRRSPGPRSARARSTGWSRYVRRRRRTSTEHGPAARTAVPDSNTEVRAAWAARTSYGKLLALLASGTSDIASAEDALADAFERALTRWPSDGVPDNPEGWLLTVARNRLRDHWKSAAIRTSVPLDPNRHDTTQTDVLEPDA